MKLRPLLAMCLFLGCPVVAGAEDGFTKNASDYAETMLRHGRDRYGKEHSPIFLTMLSRDRQPSHVHESNIRNKRLPGWDNRYYNRDWGGSNLGNHIQLHLLLGELSAATGDPKYLEASKAELRFFFEKTQSPETGLILWGEHMSWDVAREQPFAGKKPAGQPHDDIHEVNDRMPPVLWERLYAVVPDQAFRYAMGLWEHQVFDHQTGQFSRHARYLRHGPDKYAANFPRVGGWMILAWSEAHRRSTDPAYRATMLQAIDTLTRLYESSRSPVTGAIPAGIKTPGVDAVDKDFSRAYWMDNTLELACEIELAIPGLPDKLVQRLRTLQKQIDEVVLTKLEHNLDAHLPDQSHGFLRIARPDLPLKDGKMQPGDGRGKRFEPATGLYTVDWQHGYGAPLTSPAASLMLERYGATKDERYLAVARQAADRYLTIDPPAENQAPFALASAIDLMLEMHRITAEQKYLDRAIHFGRLSQTLFLESSPLPGATSSHDHYEAINGGDDLMLSLWRLGQQSAAKPAP